MCITFVFVFTVTAEELSDCKVSYVCRYVSLKWYYDQILLPPWFFGCIT